ncbi:hypothetical protein QFC20_000492 [Naganishia adeliensis]|uniref:Uncharacterized protein n=1 Tax=Naganishia adeliensis TaxID=92952 RepID=A0ACC2WXQ1_9TREE|nr:hypothetical protein QFC20_000492 [Naganishia adeliensis]
MSQPPPDYNEVIKEREEFQRDVTAAGIPVEPPLASNRANPQTIPLDQSPYPADKSGRQKPSQSAAYGQPAPPPSMGYGSTQNPYISQQPQPIGQPMHYYQNSSGPPWTIRRDVLGVERCRTRDVILASLTRFVEFFESAKLYTY